MDWSRQTLTFGFGKPPRAAAKVVAARLGVALAKTRNETSRARWESFHAPGPDGEESIEVTDAAVIRALRGIGSEEPSKAGADGVPAGPTIVVVRATARAERVIDALSGAGFVLTDRRPYPPAWVQEAEAAWQRLLPRLRGAGWQVELTCFATPVQLEGRVPAGDRFYYRCRGGACSLSVGGDEPADAAPWHGAESFGGESAGYLHPADAVRILLTLHARWLRQHQHQHGAD